VWVGDWGNNDIILSAAHLSPAMHRTKNFQLFLIDEGIGIVLKGLYMIHLAGTINLTKAYCVPGEETLKETTYLGAMDPLIFALLYFL
jgi:hypothetical protein